MCVCCAFPVCACICVSPVLTDHTVTWEIRGKEDTRSEREDGKQNSMEGENETTARKKRTAGKRTADAKYTIWSASSFPSFFSFFLLLFVFLPVLSFSSVDALSAPDWGSRHAHGKEERISVTSRVSGRSIKNLTQRIEAVGSDERDFAAASEHVEDWTLFPATC